MWPKSILIDITKHFLKNHLLIGNKHLTTSYIYVIVYRVGGRPAAEIETESGDQNSSSEASVRRGEVEKGSPQGRTVSDGEVGQGSSTSDLPAQAGQCRDWDGLGRQNRYQFRHWDVLWLENCLKVR